MAKTSGRSPALETARVQTNMRLTTECRRLLKTVGGSMGLSEAGVVELAVRAYAKSLGLKVKPTN